MIDGAGWLYKKAMSVVRDPEGRKAAKAEEARKVEEKKTNDSGTNR